LLTLLLVASLAPQSIADRSPNGRHYRPIGSLRGVVTYRDYPASALDSNEQGTVGILIRVSKNGHVNDCVVEQSSGFASLDAQTCRLVWLRAKYKPAHDRRGRPVASEAQERVTWRIAGDESSPGQSVVGSISGLISPDDYPPQALDRSEEGTVGIILHIDANGAVGGCTVEKSSGWEVLDAQTCRLLSLRAKFEPARDRQGNPTASNYHTRIKWQIGEDRVPSDPWSTRLVFNSGSDNRQRSCRFEADGAMSPAPGEKPLSCQEVSPLPFPELAELPPAMTSAVFEQRFAPEAEPTAPLPNGNWLLARQVLALQISAAGKVISCKSTQQSVDIPWSDPCLGIAKQVFDPRKGPAGQDAPFAATITYDLYARSGNPPLDDSPR
jgi:TonB family protein